MDNILIINCGGTFSKSYEPLTGNLIIKNNNKNIRKTLKKFFIGNKKLYKIKGLIYKDSLDMDDKDREELKEFILSQKEEKILVIHGTDTIDKTALYLQKSIIKANKLVVLLGSMEPLSISPAEACINIGCAYGYALASSEIGVYISMNGIVQKPENIKKNRELGYFQWQK
ncbi:asparaginase domain-containing protein [Arcobacter sp. FWKO B]|uniref:asparaginase domain-containing protein n=1 Tax=Arcobacter sp. FWKO B TaxID=2593672 RepID=UPI0018A62E8A|nr:asparaginase domain-containing protein [Arcobacter sp. FWKO B]QOG12221.1 asparaginase [Arcobacter sp. FWKO B]